MSEDFLICSVCLEEFNDHKRAPLLLACGHTFCADCIKSLLSAKSKIKCPNCNKEDSRIPKDLPKNYIITDLILKLSYTQPSKEDPWSCKLHPTEQIIYICQQSKQLLCCECLHMVDYTNLTEISSKEISDKLLMFKSLYEIASPHELKERGKFSGQLSESLECQKLKLLQSLDDQCSEVIQNIESHFSSMKKRIELVLIKEKEKFLSLKEILNVLGDMKTVGVKIDSIINNSRVTKAHEIITWLSGLNDIGSSSEVKKLSATPMDFSFKIELPAKILNIATGITESPINLIRGVMEGSDVGEKKLARFNPPTNRWGIFEGRNQIEAVTFNVNQKIYVTAIGVGNAFHAGKTVRLEKISILNGGSTASPNVFEENGIDLTYDSNAPKVVKISFKAPVEIRENADYTIKLVLRGGAGVFRGGTTQRNKNGEGGLVFKFKNTVYGGDDIKNGENADDGPIFDIYYKTVIESLATVSFVRYNGISGKTEIADFNKTPYLLGFSLNKPISLSSLTVPAPCEESSVLTIRKIEIIKGYPGKGEFVLSQNRKIEVPYNAGLKVCQIMLDQAVGIEASTIYCILIDISSPAVFKAENFISTTVTCNNIIMKFTKMNADGFKDGSELPILLMLQGSSIENLNNFTKIVIPDKFLEETSGESKIRRFENVEKSWNLSSGQVEYLTFSISEDVLISAIGIGNCINPGKFISVDTLHLLSGGNFTSSVIYDHSQKFNIFNSGDSNPVVKVRLKRAVKIEAKKLYTIRMVLAGDDKVYKGFKFLGDSLTDKNSITLKTFKTQGKEEKSMDNEKAGPIIDIYYISLSKQPSIENFNILISKLYQKSKLAVQEPLQSDTEYKVCRYNNTGSSWHVNTDGKQIEAISFQPSVPVKLIAVGIGNAFEEGKKVVVKKIQIKVGKSTQGSNKVYKHKNKEKLINTSEESRFVRIALETPVLLSPDNWYTLMVKYKPGVPVCRGTMANNQPSCNGVTFTFEKTKYEGTDVENGSHEVHGPLRDFYFTLI